MLGKRRALLLEQKNSSWDEQQKVIMHAGVMRLKRSAFANISSDRKSSQNNEALTQHRQTLLTAARLVAAQLNA